MSWCTDYRVVVVGAGAAGIGAARQLQALGANYIIVEAGRRIGGRARTDQDGLGAPFDLGASFIHAAEQGNPWADLAMLLDKPVHPDRRSRFALDRHGTRNRSGAQAYMAQRARAFEHVKNCALQNKPLDAGLGLQGDWSGPAALAVGPWLAGCDNIALDPADWLAAKSGDDWLLPAGYGALVRDAAHGLNIKTDTRVKRIERVEGGVSIATDRGVLRASDVILTVSIGVLQAEMIAFQPGLPAHVLRALDGLFMGNLTKVGIELTGPCQAFGSDHYLQLDIDDPVLPLYFVRPAHVPYIISFMGGQTVAELEYAGSDALIDAACSPLIEMIGQTAFDQSTGRRLATEWLCDPCFFGSYANARPGQMSVRGDLREPWHETIHYAGEASAPSGWQGTVAGAYLAGRDTARRLTAGRLTAGR